MIKAVPVRSAILLLVCLVFLAGCAGVQITPARTYYEAQQLFINGWTAYHLVWSSFPDSDPRKTEWVKAYHPKFLAASKALNSWSGAVNDPSLADLANLAINEVERILIELAIKKGGS